MKKSFTIALFLLVCVTISAQDVIVKKDGSTIVCRIVELNSSEIIYKRWGKLNGSNYVMNRSDASAINYENGKRVNLSETTNLYAPNNQNDGVQLYNDNALLKMDYLAENSANKKQAKIAKKIGLIAGPALVVGGTVLLYAFANKHSHGFASLKPFERFFPIGLIVAGVGTTVSCLIYSHYLNNKDSDIRYSTLYEYDFKLSNGSSLSTGIDLISDNNCGKNTLGLGLRYNF